MAPRVPLGRITREEDFRRVYRHGARRSTRLVVLHLLSNDLNSVRLGVAVGRRFGRAVARNRLRRRLREAVRAASEEIGAGVDVVVVPREPAGNAAYASLREEVTTALRAAGLLAPTGGERP